MAEDLLIAIEYLRFNTTEADELLDKYLRRLAKIESIQVSRDESVIYENDWYNLDREYMWIEDHLRTVNGMVETNKIPF